MQADVVDWPDAEPRAWSYHARRTDVDMLVFALDRLRDFSEPAFRRWGEQLAQRARGLAEQQAAMLQRLHDLGLREHCTFSLRLYKHADQLKLYVLVGIAPPTGCTDAERRSRVEQLAEQVQSILLPDLYSFERSDDGGPTGWGAVLEPAWATEIVEVLKPQTQIAGIVRPFYLYTPGWDARPDHDLRTVCETLLRQPRRALIDITLVPARCGERESKWLADAIADMTREERGGELPNIHTRRTEHSMSRPELADKVAVLSALLDAYARRPLFLHAIRVLGEEQGVAQHVAGTLSAHAARTIAISAAVRQGEAAFPRALRRVQSVAITPEVQPYTHTPESLPGSGMGQRFNRLASIDEITGFWRLPIPLTATFPGFELDTGRSRRRQPVSALQLGTYAPEDGALPEPVSLDREALTRHALIVGMPGSGKTTVIQHLLHQLWHPPVARDAIPFLVLEPAKTEYRALKRIGRFQEDMLVFTLGDERISPFRLNPFAVPVGIPVESHIAKLNACFVGAFNLFDPLPLLLDKAIRLMYEEKGWYDESIGGEPGVEVPTLTDLYECSRRVIETSGYSDRLRDDFSAALLQRLDSLRRGSKGRMLDTRASIPISDLMARPVVIELDAMNDDEKALVMMFLLTLVYEVARAERRSGSPLRHVLVAEEAHNLIGRSGGGSAEVRANPKEQAIRLFMRMLAEMRALGEGIVIADQLPTAIAPEAVKQTNVKILLRLTALDDRKEIGNAMNLNEQQMLDVARLGKGQAYVAQDDLATARKINTTSFKQEHQVEEPPDDPTLAGLMGAYHEQQQRLFMPFAECPIGCAACNRRLRSEAERLVKRVVDPANPRAFLKHNVFWDDTWNGLQLALAAVVAREGERIGTRFGAVNPLLSFCAAVHLLHLGRELVTDIVDLPPDHARALADAGLSADWAVS